LNINVLYKQACAGDKKAEERLFQHLLDSFRLFTQQRLWNQTDADEIVQDALMIIAQKYKEIEIKSNFAGWAYQVLNNKIMDFVKIRRIRADILARVSVSLGLQSSYRTDPLLEARLLECLKKTGQANHQYARILNLHYQGYATSEICRKLGLKRDYFYVSLSRARAMLAACLAQGERQ
jgi:RNA polymerase sigma factor (sigma-70 family)